MPLRLACFFALSLTLLFVSGCGDCADPTDRACEDELYRDDTLSVQPAAERTPQEQCGAYLSCLEEIEGLDGAPNADEIEGSNEVFDPESGICWDDTDEAVCGSLCEERRVDLWDTFPSVASCRTRWVNNLPLQQISNRGWDIGSTVPEIIGSDQFGELVTVDQFQWRNVVIVFVDPQAPAPGVAALAAADAWAAAYAEPIEVIAVVGEDPAAFALETGRWQAPAIEHAGSNDAWPFDGMSEAALLLGETLVIATDIEADLSNLDVAAWLDGILISAR